MSTRTAVVLGGVKLSSAVLVAASFIVPPFRSIGEADAMPSLSLSPLRTV